MSFTAELFATFTSLGSELRQDSSQPPKKTKTVKRIKSPPVFGPSQASPRTSKTLAKSLSPDTSTPSDKKVKELRSILKPPTKLDKVDEGEFFEDDDSPPLLLTREYDFESEDEVDPPDQYNGLTLEEYIDKLLEGTKPLEFKNEVKKGTSTILVEATEGSGTKSRSEHFYELGNVENNLTILTAKMDNGEKVTPQDLADAFVESTILFCSFLKPKAKDIENDKGVEKGCAHAYQRLRNNFEAFYLEILDKQLDKTEAIKSGELIGKFREFFNKQKEQLKNAKAELRAINGNLNHATLYEEIFVDLLTQTTLEQGLPNQYKLTPSFKKYPKALLFLNVILLKIEEFEKNKMYKKLLEKVKKETWNWIPLQERGSIDYR